MNPLTGINPASANVPTGMSSPMLDVLTAGNTGKGGAAQNIEAVGTEFESVFLSMMIKEMRQSLDGGFFGEESSDSYGGMFDMFIGKDLAQTRPLGIADMLLKQYEQQQSSGNDSAVPSADSIKAATSFTA